MRIFFSVGEPSGDIHGANLIRALRQVDPFVECVGYGGPKMAAAGCRLHADLTQLAVMWFLRALLNLHKFWNLVLRAGRYFRHHRPDAVVLIDYPGFNWWIARRAKVHGIPVFYYSPPQVWAWARWRVHKMRRLVDHVLSGLPFETQWLQRHGCRATFIGHPYFDEVREQRLDQSFLAAQRRHPRRLVTILPGSRTQEVERNLPWLLKAASRIADHVSDVRFAIAAFKPHHAELARRMIDNCRDDGKMPCHIHVGRTPELMSAAECCLAVSGSVSLELLYYRKPTVILYHISRFALWVSTWFIRVKYITLVNLLADRSDDVLNCGGHDTTTARSGRVPFPEYLTSEDPSVEMAAHAVRWLTDSTARQQVVSRLDELVREIGQGGAARQAAENIAAAVRERKGAPNQTPRPHYQPIHHADRSAA